LTLLELKLGDVGVINRISGGKGILARMSGLGLYEGKKIKVVQAAPFHGPLLVEDLSSGARVMIGRGVASHVEIIDEQG
jgi:Fe2+ transport system protein FeoA